MNALSIERPPDVTVVIPTYNRGYVLEKCLAALFRQTYPADRYEIVVVDDGSTDGTRSILEKLAGTSPARLIHVLQEHRGPAAARNRGLAASSGRLVVFVDSDVLAEPQFLEQHVRSHDGLSDRLIVHGQVIQVSSPDGPFSGKPGLWDFSSAFFATTNVSVSREWLVAAGLFDEDFTEYGWEDLELGKRLRRLGLRVSRCRGAVGYHVKQALLPGSLPSVRRTELERGRMAVLYFRKHPTISVRMSTLFNPAFFALERLLAAGHWPDAGWASRLVGGLMRRKAPWVRWPVAVAVRIMSYHWYADGMREALAERRAPKGPK